MHVNDVADAVIRGLEADRHVFVDEFRDPKEPWTRALERSHAKLEILLDEKVLRRVSVK